MSRFYTKNWFYYVAPFLLFFALTEAASYLPNWHFHLYLAKIALTGGLLWAWRNKFTTELSEKLSPTQFVIALLAATLCTLSWLACVKFGWINLTTHTLPTQWPFALKGLIVVIICLGATILTPILSELFWRSFMLRYLIEQDFKSVALGQFQFFSFIVVVALTTLPSPYTIPIAVSCCIQNILIIWQKNLRCCIVANMLTNSALTLYFLIYGYQIL